MSEGEALVYAYLLDGRGGGFSVQIKNLKSVNPENAMVLLLLSSVDASLVLVAAVKKIKERKRTYVHPCRCPETGGEL